MTDVYRESRLRKRIRCIIHPRDAKDKRVLCYNPLSYVIDYYSDFMHGVLSMMRTYHHVRKREKEHSVLSDI